ncbi:A24 family peptidase [Microbacterium sp. NE2HP2]|uniref:prepilin peptidase n=1 Tax=Microbacterium TaxID=33882 RepID=UPI00236503B2|nr:MULTISPECIES: A24 family peptidase [Microbacterium]MDD7943265.1 A24 family peptidase [Microbacterium plantarum]WHE37243.1 A24 family peptidase [Microbacterium sp. BDGP8]
MTAVSMATLVVVAACAVLSVALAAVDIATHRLPNRLVLGLAGAAASLAVLFAIEQASMRPIVGAAGAGIVLFVVYYLLHRGGRALGGGDVKLAAAIGLLTGTHDWVAPLVATALAFFSGGLVAVVVIAARRGDRHTRIPFGPFMLLGAWAVVGGVWVGS